MKLFLWRHRQHHDHLKQSQSPFPLAVGSLVDGNSPYEGSGNLRNQHFSKHGILHLRPLVQYPAAKCLYYGTLNSHCRTDNTRVSPTVSAVVDVNSEYCSPMLYSPCFYIHVYVAVVRIRCHVPVLYQYCTHIITVNCGTM